MSDLTASLLNAKQELLEFKLQSQEYEEELENELKYKEAQLSLTLIENNDLKSKIEDLKNRIQKSNQETDSLLKENDKNKSQIKQILQDRRRLEDLNDYWENSARILEHSRQALEEKLVEAAENAILYKEELEVVALKKEEEIQRLKDEFNEMRTDLEVKKGGKLGIQMTGKILIDSPVSKRLKHIPRHLCFDGFIKFFLDFQDIPNSENFQVSGKKALININKKDQKTFEFSDVWENNRKGFECLSGNFSDKRSGCFISYSNQFSTILMKMLKFLLKKFNKSLPPETEIRIFQQILTGNESKSFKLNSSLYHLDSLPLSTFTKENIKAILSQYLENMRKKSLSSHSITTVHLKSLNICIQFAELGVATTDMKESLQVNKALSTLEACLSAIKSNQKYIPIRNSALTSSLSMTLTQSSQIHFIFKVTSDQSLQEMNSFLSVMSRINFLHCSVHKTIKTAEVERTLTLLNNEHREKQQLMIFIDKLQKELKFYKEFYMKNCENRKLTNTPISNCKSCKTSPRHSNIRIPSSRFLFSPHN
jgi:hypothetical protein